MTELRRLARGQTAVRRYFRGPYVSWAQATTVVADDEQGLVLWLPEGADFACRTDAAGSVLRGGPTVEAYGAAPLSRRTWERSSVLLLHPPGAAHSVWWFFHHGRFDHWYVNLESPLVRQPGGIDIVDHHLDVVVDADRTWRWKDEDDFVDAIGRPGFWSADQACAIRAEADRVTAIIETGLFPYDGTWCDFTPDPTWPLPQLPPQMCG